MLLPLQLLWYNVDVHNSRSCNINSMTSLLNRKFCPPLVVSNHSILTQNYPAGMFFLPWQIGELNYYALIGATFVNSTKSVDICTMRGWWNMPAWILLSERHTHALTLVHESSNKWRPTSTNISFYNAMVAGLKNL